MAADSADFQRLYTLSRVATNRQQFEAAVTATAAENTENPAATTSQGNLICFDEGSATHEAHPPAYSVFEGARHITPSPLPESAESREPSRQTCSTHSAPAPDLTGQSESPQVLLRDAMRMIECLTGVVQNTLTSSSRSEHALSLWANQQQRDHLDVRRKQQWPAIRSSLRRVFYARPGSCGPQLVTSRGAATGETTAAAHGEKKQTSKTAKKFPVRSGGSGLGKFWKLGDTSIPSPSLHHRNPVTWRSGAEQTAVRQTTLPAQIHGTATPWPRPGVSSALCPTMPGNGASRKVKRRWSVPQHSSTGPPHATNGRPHQHHQPPAAPKVSRAQDQLSDSSSSSPGTPPWPATADDSATTAAEGSPLTDMTFLTA
ncbi:hypothetical protein HPB50_021838 [Hyalomma asiaticum]|uniref:Uncharacterized protein n=1 Tax=Hyalomma asiaticum TaxID=266040 RepID=A0ACB7TNV3_HYAAI|nr:hypothetical protein HPB50_021838 [Hyalomma asiaticum]